VICSPAGTQPWVPAGHGGDANPRSRMKCPRFVQGRQGIECKVNARGEGRVAGNVGGALWRGCIGLGTVSLAVVLEGCTSPFQPAIGLAHDPKLYRREGPLNGRGV
jgi:hypothetical protein